MYPNLKAEMARAGINLQILAERIDMPYSTLVGKMSGRTEFTVGEAFAIRKALAVEIPIEVLFEKAVAV